MTEYMDLVNNQNEVIGSRVTKEEVYEKKLPHRIVHIFVINPQTKEIYLQRRADTVSFLPGFYCTSAGGHVRASESYEEAAVRESGEELGLRSPLSKLTALEFVSSGHKRFIELFVSFSLDTIVFRDGEVKSGEFLSFEDAYALVQKNEKIHPQLGLCFDWVYNHKDEVLAKINL